MAADAFYRGMSDNQLQATFKEIEKNIKFDPSEGMKKEMQLIQDVAKERGIELGDPFATMKGYMEFGLDSQKRSE